MKEKRTTKGILAKIGKAIARPFVVAYKWLIKSIKAFFSLILSSKLGTLVAMQLKDKWNFSFKTNKKGAIFKLITLVVIFVVICAGCYLVLNLACSYLFLSSAVPVSAMVFVLTILTIFEAGSILIGLTNSLFFSKDNVVLITYPVKADLLFISKVIVYFLDALKKSFTLLVPVLIGYGIMCKLPVYYYFWVIFGMVFYIILLVSMCAILSIPTFYVMRFLNKYRVIKLIFTIVILGAIIFGVIKLIGIIPENINLIKTYAEFSKKLNIFLNKFSNALVVMAAVGAFFCGVRKGLDVKLFSNSSWIVFAAILGLILVFVFVDMLLAKPFYNKMIASRSTFKTKAKRDKTNKVHGKLSSLIRYEDLRIFRDKKILSSSLICLVVTPLFILLANKIYSSFQTRTLGDEIIVLFNFLFIAIFTFTHNITSSYIFSKDGPSWNINKTIPVDPRPSLLSRLVYNFVMSLFIIIPSSIIFISRETVEPVEAAFFILTLIFASLFHSILSASYDFMHSENKTKADIGSEYIHRHETISLAFALITALVGFGLGFIMYYTATNFVFVRLSVFAFIKEFEYGRIYYFNGFISWTIFVLKEN